MKTFYISNAMPGIRLNKTAWMVAQELNKNIVPAKESKILPNIPRVGETRIYHHL